MPICSTNIQVIDLKNFRIQFISDVDGMEQKLIPTGISLKIILTDNKWI